MTATSLLIVDRNESPATRTLLDLAAEAFLARRRIGSARNGGTLVLEASGWGGAPRKPRRWNAKVVSPNAVLGPEAMESEVLERAFASSRELIQLGADKEKLFPEHRAVDLGLLNLLRIQYYLRDFYAIQAAAETLLEAEEIDRCHLLSADPSLVDALSYNLGNRGIEFTSATPGRLKRWRDGVRWARLRLQEAVTPRPSLEDSKLKELAGLEPAVLFVSESKPMDQMFRRVETILGERGTTSVVRVGLAKAQRDPERPRHVRHLFLDTASDRSIAAEVRFREWRHVVDRFGSGESVSEHERDARIPVRTLFTYLFRELLGTQMAHVERTSRVLDALRPGVVVVGNDHFWVGQAYVQLARSRGIPTVAVQDGAAYDAPPWWWSTADVTATSGSALVEYMTRHGTPEDRCVVTGQPRYDRLAGLANPEEQEAARRRLGFRREELVILFATQYGQDPGYVRSVVDALGPIPESRIVLRPHPSQDSEFHRKLAREAGSDAVMLCEDQDILDLVGACDLLVAHNSTVILEAAYLGKQIIVANFGDLPERLPYEDFASATVVRHPTDLTDAAVELAAKLRSGEDFARGDVKPSVSPILGPVDGRAGQRVADLLEAVIEGSHEDSASASFRGGVAPNETGAPPSREEASG